MFENAKTLENGNKANRATRAAIVVGNSSESSLTPGWSHYIKAYVSKSTALCQLLLDKRQRHGHNPFTGKIKAAQSLPALLDNPASHGFQKEWLPQLRGDHAGLC